MMPNSSAITRIVLLGFTLRLCSLVQLYNILRASCVLSEVILSYLPRNKRGDSTPSCGHPLLVLIMTDSSLSFALTIGLLNIAFNYLTVCWLHPFGKVVFSMESCKMLSKAASMSMKIPRVISLVVIDFSVIH